MLAPATVPMQPWTAGPGRLDFFVASLIDSSYSKFLRKNGKFEAILKVYYMINDITVKINDKYEFF